MSPLEIVIISLVLLILSVLSMFFSLSETSIIALSKLRLRHMVSKGVKHAQSIHRLVTSLDKFIAAILVGNNFVNIGISAIVSAIFVHMLGDHIGVLAATFVTTLYVLVFCEITPKILATKNSEKIALRVAPIMEFIVKLFRPFVIFFTSISGFLIRLLKMEPAKRTALITEEELKLIIEIGKEEGVLSDEERKMLHRIFEFGDIKVGDVMIPKDKIVAVSLNSTAEHVLDTLAEQGHGRIPVYKGSIDSIVGVIYARDLLYILRDNSLFILQDILHKPYYVPAAMRVSELLRKFQAEKIQLAVVVGDDNVTLGIATLEDLIEEIVGEIEERYMQPGK